MNVSVIGEICVSRSTMENGKPIMIIVIYISPKKTAEIIKFVQQILQTYTAEGAALLDSELDKFQLL